MCYLYADQRFLTDIWGLERCVFFVLIDVVFPPSPIGRCVTTLTRLERTTLTVMWPWGGTTHPGPCLYRISKWWGPAGKANVNKSVCYHSTSCLWSPDTLTRLAGPRGSDWRGGTRVSDPRSLPLVTLHGHLSVEVIIISRQHLSWTV